jgi:hypothetical protein
VALAIVFPEGGYEPFGAADFWPTLAGVLLVAGVALALRQSSRGPLRASPLLLGAVLYAVALTGAFLLRTPVGSNAARLGALLAGPLLAGALLARQKGAADRRRTLLALGALVPALLYWQLSGSLEDLTALAGDRSVEASYYAPLLTELRGLAAGSPTRVEIVPTAAHWEAAYVPGPVSAGSGRSAGVMLARGWERQLDTRYAGLFYAGGQGGGAGKPTAAAYWAWLRENGVSYVALSDARTDTAGLEERALIERGLPFLRAIWRSRDWRLYAVLGAPSLAQAPATLTAVGVDWFTLRAPRPGPYRVAVRFTPYWALQTGRGCVSRAQGGWTEVQVREGKAGGGLVRVGIDFSPGRIFSQGARCRG